MRIVGQNFLYRMIQLKGSEPRSRGSHERLKLTHRLEIATPRMFGARRTEQQPRRLRSPKNQLHRYGLATILAFSLVVGGCSKGPTPLDQSPASGQLKHFIAEKKAQATAAAATEKQEMLPEFKEIFAAAEKGDWETVSNRFEGSREFATKYSGRTTAGSTSAGFSIRRFLADWWRRISEKADEAKMKQLHGTQWEDVKEIRGMFDCLASDVELDKHFVTLGQDIIHSIPKESIYLGGSDPGRWTVTALQTSHVKGDPFFTLTQNAMADPSYLEYLRSMFGTKIYIPTANDSQKCFQDYMEDAQLRILHDQTSPADPKQIKPGEDVRVDGSGHVQVSGQVAVMAINAELVKVVFDHETNHEFYVEESFPLDWMFPHLEPHGLIMKINREPMAELSDEVIRKDHEFWRQRLAPVIGDWLKDDTSVQEVCAFADKVFVKHDFAGFKGDPRIVTADWPKWMSKLRSSIGGMYQWRLGTAPSGGIVPEQYIAKGEARDRLIKETDFAYRQAFAVCPYSPEVVYRYAQFLVNQKRAQDALAVTEIAMRASQGKADAQSFRTLLDNLKSVRSQESPTPAGSQSKP
jgi:hypothetical protein